MIKIWRNKIDQGKSCAALLTDLSKALDFDCIVHKFLKAKLDAYISYAQLPYRWETQN